MPFTPSYQQTYRLIPSRNAPRHFHACGWTLEPFQTNAKIDPLCWRGDLEEGWAALWTSENPQRVGTGGGGTSRWAELNVWAEADVGFLPSNLHPTPFPRLFIYLVPAIFLHCRTEYMSAAEAPERSFRKEKSWTLFYWILRKSRALPAKKKKKTETPQRDKCP